MSSDFYETHPSLASDFLFRCCYLNNYLTRRLRGLKLTRAFRGVLVEGGREEAEPGLHVTQNLVCRVKFSPEAYLALRPFEEHEFYIGMLVDGLECCAEMIPIPIPIPIVELKSWIEEFRAGGYRNEWTHKSKLLRPTGLRASLLCALDADAFRLRLKLERKDVAVFDREILKTRPDELIFAHRFKDVVVDGDAIVVKDLFDKVLFSLPIADVVDS